jgi:hypothetical protein
VQHLFEVIFFASGLSCGFQQALATEWQQDGMLWYVVETKQVFPSDWSFKDDAFTKILLLDDFDNDFILSDMNLSECYVEYSQKPNKTKQKQ